MPVVEASNTPTIRRLTLSRRHQLSPIAPIKLLKLLKLLKPIKLIKLIKLIELIELIELLEPIEPIEPIELIELIELIGLVELVELVKTSSSTAVAERPTILSVGRPVLAAVLGGHDSRRRIRCAQWTGANDA